ncbi:MAG: anti-sigma factor [Anaerolineae bacterium]|nr:anti-sigma factor [Anaerolineae bacterium]MDW8099684.1 anti-sigma factor [Anaerolineae bacterium]
MGFQFTIASLYPDGRPNEEDRIQMVRLYFGAAIAIGVAVVLMLSVFMAVVQANGAPVDIFLNHIPGISNWGPSWATGHALVAVGEGEVHLETKGLPRLKDEHYQVWLERADTGEFISIGVFNSDNGGKGELHILLDDLPYTEYRAMWITVESSPDPDPAPSEKRALIGRFPNMQLAKEALLQPAAGPSAGRWAGGDGPRPEFLPVTGGTREVYGEASLSLQLLLIVGVVAVAAWYVRRRIAR